MGLRDRPFGRFRHTQGKNDQGHESGAASGEKGDAVSEVIDDLVERFFAEITRKRIRRGVFKSVTDLEIAIHYYLAEHNDHPKPFVWNAKAADILAKVRRGKQALESEQEVDSDHADISMPPNTAADKNLG